MNRMEKFHSFKDHVMHGKLMTRLSAKELKQCEDFIRENDALDSNQFAEKTNRWLLDQPKPKNYSTMWALVLQCNSTEIKKSR